MFMKLWIFTKLGMVNWATEVIFYFHEKKKTFILHDIGKKVYCVIFCRWKERSQIEAGQTHSEELFFF